MFGKGRETGYAEILPGIRIKTLVHGEKTLMVRFVLSAGSLLPEHSHIYEQTGYLVEGRMRLHIGDSVFETEPGDSWCVAPDVRHSSEVLEDSVAVEVFSPARQDYLKYFTPEEGGRK